MGKPDKRALGQYTGLEQLEATLPSAWYFDPAHYERELSAIWYDFWVYVGRAETLPGPLTYRRVRIGSQEILLLRDEAGSLRAFHNTCRHRGSLLCTEGEGRLRSRALTCPYHAWTYDLQGTLQRVPGMALPPGFDKSDYPLFAVSAVEWQGCLFVHLGGAAPETLMTAFGPDAARLANWPLAELTVVHRVTKRLACNWKIFWENFNECYHCPGVHPELSRMVPIYGRAIMSPFDDPEWQKHKDSADPRYRGGLREGAATWSRDGQVHGPTFPTLTAEERGAGQRFATLWPTLYIVGHVDYMRIVSMRPLGPEETELTAEWLLPQGAASAPGFDLENLVSFARTVILEDGAACELQQGGLRAKPFREGVLMPQEYAVHAFQQWVRERLAQGAPA